MYKMGLNEIGDSCPSDLAAVARISNLDLRFAIFFRENSSHFRQRDQLAHNNKQQQVQQQPCKPERCKLEYSTSI